MIYTQLFTMNKKLDSKTLLVNNQIGELHLVADYLNGLEYEWGLSGKLISSLNLVLEEALTNIISYGFDDDQQHTITINFKKAGNELSISIIDDGHAFDPTSRTDPDITLPAVERPIGGLGIFLIKQIMDKVEYQRKEDKNYFILIKNIEP